MTLADDGWGSNISYELLAIIVAIIVELPPIFFRKDNRAQKCLVVVFVVFGGGRYHFDLHDTDIHPTP